MPRMQSQAAEDVTAPLCCAQGLSGCIYVLNHDGSLRNVDAGTTSADQANAEVSLSAGSCATRLKRAASPSNTLVVSSSLGIGRSSILSNGVSQADETHSTIFCSLAAPSANITSSISSIHETITASNSAKPVFTLTSLSTSTPSLFSSHIPQTPFTSMSTETLITISKTLPSSASPIGLTLTSTLTDADPSAASFQSTVIVITLPTVWSRSSPSFTMSNSDTVTLAPVYSTSSVIPSTYGPGTTQSTSDTTLISSISSIPFLSSAFFSPIPSTSDFSTPIISPYPSISVISLSGISTNTPTVTSTSTSAGGQTITVSSTVVETGTLSTDTPHDTGFAHQTGAIIGVVIAGTFVLLLIISLIFFACKRYRSNRFYNSSTEDILTVSRVTPWRPPLEADDDDHYLAMTTGNQGSLGDRLPVEGGSADDHGPWSTSGGQPLVSPVSLPRSPNSKDGLLFASHSSNDSQGNSQPWWGNTEPLNTNSPRQLPPSVDSHVTVVASESTSTLGFGGSSSNGHRGPGSSGEALLPKGNRGTSITEPRPIHRLSGRRHYSAPPTAFVLGRNSSLEYSSQRIQQYQEEQNQQDRADKSISQAIFARLRASRRSSIAPTVKAYSQCTIESEESAPSRAPSYMSPSLLNPPISMSQTVPRRVDSNYATLIHHPSLNQEAHDTFEGLGWLDVLPPAPSPAPTDTSSMVEGLLHPRLGMALAPSQQGSATSLRDHEDYTRPINGLVNNRVRSTTTFETQDTLDLGEGET